MILIHITSIIVLTHVAAITGQTKFDVTIRPKHFHLNTETSANITCQANQPLAQCEFKVFDLTNGFPYQTVTTTNYTVSAFLYISGKCSFTLNTTLLRDEHYYVTTCRVRSATSDWAYASMSVYKSQTEKISILNPASEAVALPGATVRIVLRNLGERATLKQCSFKYPRSNRTIPLFFTGASKQCVKNTVDVKYQFYGGDQAECALNCGVTFNKATEDHNGIIVFLYESSWQKEISFVNVIVAKPPKQPKVRLLIKDGDKGSMILQATCTVTGSRPAPEVSWYLDKDQITNDHVTRVLSDKWTWPSDEQTVTQQLDLKLNTSHIGRTLFCYAFHSKLNWNLSSNIVISKFNMPTPLLTKPVSGQPTSSGLSKPSSATSDEHRTSKTHEVVAVDVTQPWLIVVLGLAAVLLAIIISLLAMYTVKRIC